MSRKRAFFLVIVLSAAALHAASIIVPGAQASTEANGDNGFPFNLAAFGLPSQRYQQVYASSEFPGAILISGIDFRPDAGSGAAFSSTLPSIQIDLSTTSAPVDGLSSTFANNVGANDTVVFAMGSLSLSSADTGPAGGPKAFDIHIVFTTPFLYNPANGNLLLDVRNFGGGATTQFDAEDLVGDSISRVFTAGGQSVASTTGTADTEGLITQFDFTTAAVPEPATGLIAGISLLALGALKRQTR